MCVYIVVSLLLNVISTIYCHFITQSHPWSLLFYIHLFHRLFCLLLFRLFRFFNIFLYTKHKQQQQKWELCRIYFIFLLFLFFLFLLVSFICCCLFPLSYVVHISYNNFFFIYLFIYFFYMLFFWCPSHSLGCFARFIYLFFSIK